MADIEIVYSQRGKRHTVYIEYDRYQREYGVYYDGKLYCHADTYSEAQTELEELIKHKRLRRAV